MNNDADIKRFIDDPSLLIELCREVIGEIYTDSENAEIIEKEAQLREISRSIGRLEKAGIAIPEAFRAEKTRLAASLGTKAEVSQSMIYLSSEFEKILSDLKEQLGGKGGRKKQGPRSKSPNTSMKVLRKHIIQALKKFGGKARSSEVVEEVGRQLEGKLLPRDLELRGSQQIIVWKHNVHWERFIMVHDGLLRNDSPRGYWELNEDHK